MTGKTYTAEPDDTFKKLEEALLLSEAKFRMLAETAPVAISIYQDRKRLFTNDAACVISGYSKEELMSLSFLHLSVPEAVPSVIALFEQAERENLSTVRFTHQIRTKQGEIRWIDVSVRKFPLIGDDALISITLDITEHHQTEQALREREARYSQLVDLLPDGVAIHRQGKVRFLNKSALEILGVDTADEIIGHSVMQFVHPDYRQGATERLQHLLATGEGTPFTEVKFLRPDGREFDVEVAAFPFVEQGKTTVQVVFRDITERKKTEQALQERETWYSQLVDLLPDGVVIHRQGKLLFLNKSALKILGIDSGAEIIGQSAMKFVHPDYRQVAAERIQRLLATGERTPFIEEKFLRLDGSEIDVEVAAFPFTEQGETAVQVVLRDITARKLAEHTLQQHARRLELLSEIDRASLTAQPLEEIARSALVSLRELIPCQRASVALFDASPSTTVTIIAVESSESKTFPPGTTFSIIDYRGMLFNLEQGKPLVFPDVRTIAKTDIIGKLWSKNGIASLAIVPLFIHGQLIGSLNLASDQVNAFQDIYVDIAREVADRLAVAMQNARLFTEVNAANERLQRLSQRLVQVQEEERRYVVRELHDEIGQSLTALNLTLQLANHASFDQVTVRLDEAQEMIADLMHRTRELSLVLRPAMLDDLGLRPSLEWFFERYTRQVQINVDFSHDKLDQHHGGDIDITVFRIIQEALTNVARHAQTDKVKVRLWQDEHTLNMIIQDDGVGFDVEQTLHKNLSSGLSGMGERVKALSGSINIESEPGTGVRIVVHLPLGEISRSSQEEETS